MKPMDFNRRRVEFTKMHATGNDFIIIENMPESLDLRTLMRRICDRHFGIGADGLMLIGKNKNSNIQMIYYNQDGSIAKMCGNGLRCFSRYVYENNIVNTNCFEVDTLAGMYNVEVIEGSNQVKIKMGTPDDKSSLYKLDDSVFAFVEMGVPHCIILVDEIDETVLTKRVHKLKVKNEKFDDVNINFVRINNFESVTVWTWERGAGHTLSCGTGVCASVWVLYNSGKLCDNVSVNVAGGKLNVSVDKDMVYLKGEAVFVAQGKFYINGGE